MLEVLIYVVGTQLSNESQVLFDEGHSVHSVCLNFLLHTGPVGYAGASVYICRERNYISRPLAFKLILFISLDDRNREKAEEMRSRMRMRKRRRKNVLQILLRKGRVVVNRQFSGPATSWHHSLRQLGFFWRK